MLPRAKREEVACHSKPQGFRQDCNRRGPDVRPGFKLPKEAVQHIYQRDSKPMLREVHDFICLV